MSPKGLQFLRASPALTLLLGYFGLFKVKKQNYTKTAVLRCFLGYWLSSIQSDGYSHIRDRVVFSAFLAIFTVLFPYALSVDLDRKSVV